MIKPGEVKSKKYIFRYAMDIYGKERLPERRIIRYKIFYIFEPNYLIKTKEYAIRNH